MNRGTSVAAAYYNDPNVTNFYRLCWGGSDIHIGKYATGDESVAVASTAMTQHLLELAKVKQGEKVIDIACGYGGTLRMLAAMGCHTQGIDISTVCIEEARKANRRAEFTDIVVNVGDFHAIESQADGWDVVICQESIIHSQNRPKVFSEAYRILRPGGRFVFSDILTSDGADIDSVEAAFSRLGAKAGATPSNYKAMALNAGFEVTLLEERQADIQRHYAKLAELLSKPLSGLRPDAVASIASNIQRWQSALAEGHITWACFLARKPH